MAHPQQPRTTSRPNKTAARAPKAADTAVTRDASDSGEKYAVWGKIALADKTPAAGLRVVAYDRDEAGENLLGRMSTTAPDGGYRINYAEADFRRSKSERAGADVIVRVYRDGELLFTSKAKNNAPAKFKLDISLREPPFVVRGTVRDAAQQPVSNVHVRAWDRDLRIAQPLGGDEAKKGEFRIEYHPANFRRGDTPSRRTPWLIVEVLESAGGKVLATQEVQKADRDQTVTFTLANVGSSSEFRRTRESAEPLLKGQAAAGLQQEPHHDTNAEYRDIAPWELTPADMDFIARDAELSRPAVQAWVASSRMMRDALRLFAEAGPPQHAALTGHGWPFFYALARQGLASDLAGVLRASPEQWREAWLAATEVNRVPSLDEKDVGALVDALVLLQRLRLLDPARTRESDLGRVVAGSQVTLPTPVALDVLSVYEEKGLGDADAFLAVAERHPEADAQIRTFVRGVRVHRLVGGHDGLSNVLNARLQGTSDSIQPLAALSSTEWSGIAGEASVTPALALRVQAAVERQHPLPALQARLDGGQLAVPGVSSEEVRAFMKTESARADSLLRGKTPTKDRIDRSAPALHQALGNLGLFARNGLSFELAARLMGRDIKSPGAAFRYGREHIRNQLLETLSEKDSHEIVDAFFAEIEPPLNGAQGFVIDIAADRAYARRELEEFRIPLPDPVLENLPTLPGLFGDLDECSCRPCESMLGQPAYLVDLLNLLRKEPGAFQVLESRRPDIPDLPLTCEQAETRIQHIDIVLEILEKAAAPGAAGTAVPQAAYANLARGVFPWVLPFDRAHAELKSSLAELRVQRSDLLALRTDTSALQLAAETLGVAMAQAGGSGAEWEAMTRSRSGNDLWAAYGFTPVAGRVTLVDPASAELLDAKPVQEVLARVSVLLDRTGLDLGELEQLLETKFVTGSGATLALANRAQCKTSLMRLPGSGQVLETHLDRLHRFVRLRRKFPDCTIPQLGDVLVAIDGVESAQTTDRNREDLLVRWARIRRLYQGHGIPLAALADLPGSSGILRRALGLTAPEFSMLTELTALDMSRRPSDFAALEDFCVALARIREVGLSVEQVAQALLAREQWIALQGELPAGIKTDTQIHGLLLAVQRRLRAVVDIQPGVPLAAQVFESVSAIFDPVAAGKLVEAIRAAGETNNPVQPSAAVFEMLHGSSGATHELGDWTPLVPVMVAQDILAVSQTGNVGADERFAKLLRGIGARRREGELVSAVAEQSGLPQVDVARLLTSQLLLAVDGAEPTSASDIFLGGDFVGGQAAPSVAVGAGPWVSGSIPRLYAWTDRLHRLAAIRGVLGLDTDLMHLSDRLAVEGHGAFSWRDLLASGKGPWRSAWLNPHWHALLALVWLQQPERVSRPVLVDLLARLQARGSNPVQAAQIRPLAMRLGMTEARVMAISAQVMATPNALDMRDQTKLRRVFELLLLARRLGAESTQLDQLANVGANAPAAQTASALLQATAGAEAWPAARRRVQDPLRGQRRDALVAYLVGRDGNDSSRSANDLFERHLIDPGVAPCSETTRLLEAITATQLLAQRILFGLEAGIHASGNLRKHWTWMRNYRVWEANRKVFLFPENWLFPELRDDKSSSFRQLESALGQGELTGDLAVQSFGQFLDDVAQMGQVEVLGMYEEFERHEQYGYPLTDAKSVPKKRKLYVVGRTTNPPYAYFWRHCLDFGTAYMEWSPWHRIELDIQGDHVLPFVLGGSLYLGWPLIRRIKASSGNDEWEVKLAWSRHDGKSWRRASISRESWIDKVPAFADERRGFAFRGETSLDGSVATISVYALANHDGAVAAVDGTPDDLTPPAAWLDTEKNPIYAGDENAALGFLKALLGDDENYWNLPAGTQQQIRIYEAIKTNWNKAGFVALDDMIKPVAAGGRRYIFQLPAQAIERYEFLIDNVAPLPPHVLNDPPSSFYRQRFVEEFLVAARQPVDGTGLDYQYFNFFYTTVKKIASRRTVRCKAWIKLKSPDSEDTSYLNLDGVSSEGTYSCTIGASPIAFTPGIDTPMEWKLGNQPALSCALTLTVMKSMPTGPAPVTLVAPAGLTFALNTVAAGTDATQTVHFVIDGTMHNAAEIGFDLDARKRLMPVTEFQLSRDDRVSIGRPASPHELYNPVSGARPWMNGFREISALSGANAGNAFQVATASNSRTSIFDRTRPSSFWVVGSATSKLRAAYDVPNEIPMAWHYSEGGRGGYIDLGYRVGLADSGLRVYPDSYPEATLRRSEWSGSQALPSLQASSFGSEDLPAPAPAIVEADTWTRLRNGQLAFDARLPYACYNWEVFFHAPLLIADQLSKQHKFEQAERWLRYVFDPTSGATGTDARRFMKFRVFKEMDRNQQVIDDLTALAQAAGGFATTADVAAVERLIGRWRDAPFRPFAIARRRHIAFLWRTLFAYLDNLIAWADSLYRRDTMESVSEATMLYVLAERILGRRPQRHEGKPRRPALTYRQAMDKWDEFANYWIDVGTQGPGHLPTGHRPVDTVNQPSAEGMLYFCIPANDKITSYWSVVESRLSNLRNCRNIDGIARTLPLMDAPIDPELLVRATAAGLDLNEAINGLYAPPPHYRYGVLSARAAELVSETKALGGAMLSAIEKRDAEQLSQLRSSNEIDLLKLVQAVRALQIAEAERHVDVLRASRRTATARYEHLQRLLGKQDIHAPSEGESPGEESMFGRTDGVPSGPTHLGLIDTEKQHLEQLETAYGWTVAGGVTKGMAGAAHLSASILHSTTGGIGAEVLTSVGAALSTTGEMFELVSRGWQHGANRESIVGSHIRRRDEWAFQNNQCLKELQQIDRQILANQIRIDVTKKELDNHVEQIEQAKALDEVMRSKFSNAQLYEWMRTQLYGLYSSAYRMALEMARRAERAAVRELGVKPLNVVRNDHWDSLRDGLLAGERLHQDLKRLEVTYLDHNRREYELTKHVSLRRLDPRALVELRTRSNGSHQCTFDVPEWLFDLDAPGLYLRRIKSVSVSIPCVVGPYSGVNCKLTLLKSEVRHEATALAASYPRPASDASFTDYFGASEAIVTSTGNGDSGLFETQLRDERFLPFEGSGVISRWRLELPAEYPQFDYSTISDVVLTIRYTARDGGDSLRRAATAAMQGLVAPRSGLPLLFPVLLSCRSDFAAEWARARATPGVPIDLRVRIEREVFPYWLSAAQMVVREIATADLPAAPTAAPAFSKVWSSSPTGPNSTNDPLFELDASGFGTVTLRMPNRDIVDRLVLLFVGHVPAP